MARSTIGRAAVVTVLFALGQFFLAQLAAFVTPSVTSSASSRNLRSRVSLAATKADVDAALKVFKLQEWAAEKLASEGSPLAAAAASRAQQAEAAYLTLKAESEGVAPPAAAAPAEPAPVAAAPVEAAPAAVASSSVSQEDLAEAKKQALLLTWAAEKLASEGSPGAASMKARAEQAVAAFEAMKEGKDTGAEIPAAAPAEPAPVAAAPVEAAPAAVAPSSVSQGDLAEAKKQASLLIWAAEKLASEGSPGAAAMKAKADQAVAAYEAMKEAKDTGAAMPAAAPAEPAPVAAAPVAAAPVAAAPVAEVPSSVSQEDLAEAKKQASLLMWAAEQLAAQGAPQAAEMQARADQAVAQYEAMKEKTLVSR